MTPPGPDRHAPVRVGVLGHSDIGRRRTLPAIAATPGMEAVCLASRDRGRAREAGRELGVEPVVGYGRLLERDDVDAVYVPLPVMLHEEWVRRCLLHGKHVLVEKPLAPDAAAAESLVSLAASLDLVLLENHTFLRHAQLARVRELLEEGAVGEVRALSAVFSIPPRPSDDIRYRPELGAGALLDVGVYPLRITSHLLGPDLDVAGAVLREDTSRGVVVSGAALLRAARGATASVVFGMEHAYRAHFEVHGSEGILRAERQFSTPDDHRPVLGLSRSGGHEEIVLEPDRQFENTLAEFRDAVRGRSSAAAAMRDSVRQARLVDAVADRARGGS
ncbi:MULTISPECIES: Gfo/Idh/MocA family protein [unclassified Nocardiopsis]|uniref:Gfo/Idh/MocA family protein n=1 Tax=Nocardiopsis TaxID=2013 RepID=UPI00387AC9A3